MLDIKKWMAKVSARLNTHTKVVETQTMTALGKTWTFRRIGNVVWLDAPNDSTGVVAGSNTIGTLNLSMRPAITQYIAPGNVDVGASGFLIIDGNGPVRFYSWAAASAARNCGFSTSFIVGGVLLNSIFKAFSRFTSSRIGGGVDAGCQEIADKDTHVDKSPRLERNHCRTPSQLLNRNGFNCHSGIISKTGNSLACLCDSQLRKVSDDLWWNHTGRGNVNLIRQLLRWLNRNLYILRDNRHLFDIDSSITTLRKGVAAC